MFESLYHALFGGIGVALIAGPLGCFVIWQRLAYLGETLAHAALLGAALSLWWQAPLSLGVAISCLAMVAIFIILGQKRLWAGDTLLGIFAQSALALGFVVLAWAKAPNVDPMSLLMGEILTMTEQDLWLIYAGVAITLLLGWKLWRPLLALTVHAELAQVEGVQVRWVQTLFFVLLTGLMVLAIKVVGILLVTAFLIIPAASARRLARTPERMALYASLLGILAVILGGVTSVLLDWPTGPSIVVAMTVLFALGLLWPTRSCSLDKA